MNASKVKSMELKIKKYQIEIKTSIDPYKNYIRVLILGLTGSGKSSLTCCLAREALTIKEDCGRQVVLVGKGIFAGSKVGTIKPIIYPDHENKLLYCDCPGFEDLRGTEEEIINAFASDYLLKSDEYDIKVKILLVISYGEFLTGRGKGILETIQRLKRMFPDPDYLKTIMGIVITKGDENRTGTDCFTSLETRANVELKKWCDFFKTFEDHVFVFPMALKENIGKQYDFIDHQRLIDFLHFSSKETINPKHQITVSNECLNELNYIRGEHFHEITNIVGNLFNEVDDEFRKIDQSSSLKFWLNCMHQLLQQNIKTANNFQETFQKLVPDCQKYNKYFEDLENFEFFDSFIDRICGIEKETSCLKETFQSLTLSAIRELESQLEKVQKSEYQDAMIKQKDEEIEENNKNLQKQRDEIQQLNIANEKHIKTIRRNQEENERKIQQIREDSRNRENQLYKKQIETQNQLNQMNSKYNSTINNYDRRLRESNDRIQQLKKDSSQKEASLSNEISEYKNKFSRLTEQFDQEKNRNASEISNYISEINDLKNLINDQSNKIKGIENREPVVIYKTKKKLCLIC